MTLPLHRLLVVLAVCSGFASCEKEAATSVEPDAGPSPEIVQYPAAAAHAEYSYFDQTGKELLASSLSEVPEAVERVVLVSVGEKTRPPDGMVYMIDRDASDDRIATARLVEVKEARSRAAGAWLGFDVGYDVWEGALVFAKFNVPVQKAGKGGGKRAGKRSPKSPPELKSVETIEIVGVSDGSALPRKSRKRSKGASGSGWKPVTMYSTKTCGRCTSARNWLKRNNVSFTEHDLNESPMAYRRYSRVIRRARLRGGVPTFVIGSEGQVMQGWNPGRFKALARR